MRNSSRNPNTVLADIGTQLNKTQIKGSTNILKDVLILSVGRDRVQRDTFGMLVLLPKFSVAIPS